jgi:GTP pyrophosphokinase
LATYSEKINWLRHIMDWQKETISPPGENLYKKIFEDRIYVFTPDGDVFDLEKGATPLDFAYHVHTDIGHRCRGAKVNDIMVPLSYELQMGDQVSIITGKENQPSRDWINPATQFLKTNAAKQKVRNWFKRQEQQHHLADGIAIWEKACRREGVSKHEIEKVFPIYKFKNAQELLMSIGSGIIGVTSVINRLKHPEGEELKKSVILPEKKIEKAPSVKSSGLQIEGVGKLLTQLAHCCQPIPGDSIIGYITKGRGVTIHQQDCHNILFTLQRYPERLLKVSWGSTQEQAYPVTLLIEADDRHGLVRDITNIIAAEHISLLGLTTRVNKLDNKAYIHFTIELKNLSPLKKLLVHLRQVSAVNEIRRL